MLGRPVYPPSAEAIADNSGNTINERAEIMYEQYGRELIRYVQVVLRKVGSRPKIFRAYNLCIFAFSSNSKLHERIFDRHKESYASGWENKSLNILSS